MWITFLDENEVAMIIHEIFDEITFCDRDFSAKVGLLEFIDSLGREHRMLAEFICSREDFWDTLEDVHENYTSDGIVQEHILREEGRLIAAVSESDASRVPEPNDTSSS
jgi:hypothetical protein